MIQKDTLKSIIKPQLESLDSKDYTVDREKSKEITVEVGFAIVLSGVRRCGKSTLLRQMMKKIRKFYYLNFEDPRLFDFQVSDFQKLEEAFKEELGDSDYYFFDEIQNVQRWELFVRSLLDRKKHVVITGSNASLLSKELGTRLTGRKSLQSS